LFWSIPEEAVQASPLARSWAITQGYGWRQVLEFFLPTLPVGLDVLVLA
jgi:hypothetical protein